MRFLHALLLMGLLAGPAAAHDLAKLRQQLAQKNDPADRAKIVAKIGEELLKQVARKYKEEAYSEGDKILADYLETVRAAHQGLQRSGRDARRSPNGFKQLEIHLRESRRKLEDIARQLPYSNRAPVEEAIAEVEALHRQLLYALMQVKPDSGDPQKEKH